MGWQRKAAGGLVVAGLGGAALYAGPVHAAEPQTLRMEVRAHIVDEDDDSPDDICDKTSVTSTVAHRDADIFLNGNAMTCDEISYSFDVRGRVNGEGTADVTYNSNVRDRDGGFAQWVTTGSWGIWWGSGINYTKTFNVYTDHSVTKRLTIRESGSNRIDVTITLSQS